MEEIISSRSGMYCSNGWMVYRMLFAEKQRLCVTPIPHLLATDHYFTEDHAVSVLRNCSAESADTVCTFAPGWKAEAIFSDDPEVKLNGGNLYLPGNSGVVVELRKYN